MERIMASSKCRPTAAISGYASPAARASAIPGIRDVALLVFPGFQIQDLGGPLAAFEFASRAPGGPHYDLHVVSEVGGPIRSSSGLEVLTEPFLNTGVDTFIVVGGGLTERPLDLANEWSPMVSRAARGSRRVASVCTGAFILAGAGLLDGRRATTHWRHAAELQKLFPRVRVRASNIYTSDGPIWTSAGVTAGIDMALALIEEDLGSEVSRAAARSLVVYHRRPGGQNQFSALLEMSPDTDRIRKVLAFMREHLDQKLSVEVLADVACLSSRQFGRSFLAETGETPAKAVERLRAEAARPRVEDTIEPIEAIARSVGFPDPERMRRAFIRTFGHPPQGMRRMAAGERRNRHRREEPV